MGPSPATLLLLKAQEPPPLPSESYNSRPSNSNDPFTMLLSPPGTGPAPAMLLLSLDPRTFHAMLLQLRMWGWTPSNTVLPQYQRTPPQSCYTFRPSEPFLHSPAPPDPENPSFMLLHLQAQVTSSSCCYTCPDSCLGKDRQPQHMDTYRNMAARWLHFGSTQGFQSWTLANHYEMH